MRRPIATLLFVAYLVVLFGLTQFVFMQPNPPRNFVPFQTIEHDIRKGGTEFVVNILGNLAAFLPMGLLLPSFLGHRTSALRVGLLSLALSLLIEALQLAFGRRIADVDDLILNTIGGLMGYGLWRIGRRLTRPRTRPVVDQKA